MDPGGLDRLGGHREDQSVQGPLFDERLVFLLVHVARPPETMASELAVSGADVTFATNGWPGRHGSRIGSGAGDKVGRAGFLRPGFVTWKRSPPKAFRQIV